MTADDDVFILYEKKRYRIEGITQHVVLGVFRDKTGAQAEMQAMIDDDTRSDAELTTYEFGADRVDYPRMVNESLGVGCTGYVIKKMELR